MPWLAALLVGLLVTAALAYEQSRGRTRLAGRPGWRWASPLVAAGAVLVSAALAVSMLATAPSALDAPASVSTEASPEPGQPRLRIPSLRVDAAIRRVPLVDGQWDISRLSAQVGWLESTGEQPGGDLAVALIGHVTLTALERGPFADLWTLQPLDEIIYTHAGRNYIYAVSEVSKVAPDEVDALYRPGGDHLLLVTCANWDYLAEEYDRRLLVDAVLVRTEARRP
jgi:LPXTG-site transpeptidase (sortase) family protein